MIPRRVYLKGFMCYREETEICFTGSSVWALCGANGAGKSAIFDAMLFALYGEHRMSKGERLTGKQNVEELIHREAESFTVEFDFALGENVYRVRRTFSRKKRGTMLALHLSGPDAPFPGRAGPQQYPGTETKDGFDSWVLQTVRLNANTFRVAVLLMQGQSDVLLKLGGAEKHDVLTQVIDLSRYEALCKLASSKQKDREISAKDFATLLNGLEKVDDAHVLDLENQMSEAGTEKERARQRHLTLTGLIPLAKRGQKLQEDEQQLTRNLTKCTALLDQAAQIEQRATRLDILQKVIAPLTQIYGWQGECANFETQIKQGREKVLTLGGSLQEQDEKLHVTQRYLTELRAQRAETDRSQKELQPRLLELQEVCSEIARLQRQQQRYKDLDQQTSAYAPDLEQQQHYLQTRLAELKCIEDAQPHLKQFAQARGNWQKATQDLAKAQEELSNQEELLTEIEKQRTLLLEQSTALSEPLNSLQSDVASKKTLQEESEKRLARFQSIDGQPTCSYCGQSLTSEHLDEERRRIEAELREAKQAYQKALTQYAAMARQKKDLEQKLDELSLQEKDQVSLALGIGKYAGNENHRLESVIIDEGFGSLDENGRREMIQAIKELGDGGVLKCIIVVSHQREFFDEFPNRYLVELVDGSTQISLA
jgi:exonuclease SbcC